MQRRALCGPRAEEEKARGRAPMQEGRRNLYAPLSSFIFQRACMLCIPRGGALSTWWSESGGRRSIGTPTAAPTPAHCNPPHRHQSRKTQSLNRPLQGTACLASPAFPSQSCTCGNATQGAHTQSTHGCNHAPPASYLCVPTRTGLPRRITSSISIATRVILSLEACGEASQAVDDLALPQ